MVEVLGVVVVTLFVGLIVWLMRFLAGSSAKDAWDVGLDEVRMNRKDLNCGSGENL